jgi:DNA end-binding protein Ku
MAPRASWKGYLKLSLVSCPVRLYTATSDSHRIHFHWLHKDTKNRIQMKPHDAELGVVDRKDLVKGYEFEKDQYVVFTDDELDEVEIESSKTITIEEFVDAAQVDPMYLDTPYYLAPDGPVAEETYRVMQQAMAQRKKAAVARVVMGGRERVVLLMPRDKGFVLNTLRTAAEVRAHHEYFADITDGALDKGALKLAEQLIDQYGGKFDSTGFVDQYQLALMELVKSKVKGTKPVISKAPERGKVINLMDALKRSIDDGKAKKPPAPSKSREAAEAKPAKSRARNGKRAAG